MIDPAQHVENKRDVSEVKPVEQLELLPTRGEKLKEDAKSLSHMLTHVPKNPYCTTCQRAKMQAKSAPNRKGLHSDGSARPKGFGVEATADHFIAKDEIDTSISGDKTGLVIHCRGSDWLEQYGTKTNDADSTDHRVSRYP